MRERSRDGPERFGSGVGKGEEAQGHKGDLDRHPGKTSAVNTISSPQSAGANGIFEPIRGKAHNLHSNYKVLV